MRGIGAAGIALSTACVRIVSFVFLWTMLLRRAAQVMTLRLVRGREGSRQAGDILSLAAAE